MKKRPLFAAIASVCLLCGCGSSRRTAVETADASSGIESLDDLKKIFSEGSKTESRIFDVQDTGQQIEVTLHSSIKYEISFADDQSVYDFRININDDNVGGNFITEDDFQHNIAVAFQEPTSDDGIWKFTKIDVPDDETYALYQISNQENDDVIYCFTNGITNRTYVEFFSSNKDLINGIYSSDFISFERVG